MTSIKLRGYQQDAVDRMREAAGRGQRPLGVLPTGSGKSWVAADLLMAYPRALCLVHVKELVEQNTAVLSQLGADVTICCAGLGSKDLGGRFIVGSRATVANLVPQLPHLDAVVIDEAHLVSAEPGTQYAAILRAILERNRSCRIYGLTATPWRLGAGHLTQDTPPVFTDVAYEVPMLDLVESGNLVPLKAYQPKDAQISVAGLKPRATGDYAETEIHARASQQTGAIVTHTLTALRDRNRALIFCTGVDHCEEMAAALRQAGARAQAVTSKTGERDDILRAYKAGELDAVTSCGVLTVGFDDPPTDVLVMARPTASPTLYVQMAGRALRPAPGKQDALLLDFAGNVARHGPITAPQPPKAQRAAEPSGESELMPCPCPECSFMLASERVRSCPECGWQAPAAEKDLTTAPDAADPMQDHAFTVQAVELMAHTAKSGQPCLKALWHLEGRDWAVPSFYAIENPKAQRWARRTLKDHFNLDWPQVPWTVSQGVKLRVQPPAKVRLRPNANGFSEIFPISNQQKESQDK